MSENIFFEDERIRAYSKSLNVNSSPWIVRQILKTGLFKDQKRAERLLMIIAVVVLFLSILLMFWVNRDPKIETLQIKIKTIQQ